MVVVTLLLAASLLVTCDLLFPPEDDGGEYTDVEYETVGAKGNERVKTVKVYLKPDNLDKDVTPGPGTYGVKKSAEQRRIERALSLEGARMSHDYFEAVFMPNATEVARAAWEIGQPAGISNLRRNGSQYNTFPKGAGSAVIFVGKKTGKTLLGVGWVTAIDNQSSGTIWGAGVVAGTESITFTVSALATWIGFNGATPATPLVTPFTLNTTRWDIGPAATGFPTNPATATFVVSSVGTTADEASTRGENISPRGTGAIFPMFWLPTVKGVTGDFVANALYRIGGLTAATTGVTDQPDLSNMIYIWGDRDAIGGSYPAQIAEPNTLAVTSTLKGGLQWIKRTPAFMSGGINYEINDTFHDKKTKIEDTTRTGYPGADAQFPATGLPVTFEMKTAAGNSSGGIFAVTFQVPVYALKPDRAYNSGTLPPEKWWIRPDYSQYQYLLDNGKDSGGAVLLGTDVQGGGGDWIQINTTGIGFNNE